MKAHLVRQLGRAGLSEEAAALVDQEELRAARVLNIFRYVFLFLISFPVGVALIFNLNPLENVGVILAFSIFAATALGHTLFLRSKQRDARSLMISNLVVATVDVLMIAFICLYYYSIQPSHNFAFVVKNNLHIYFFLPLMTTLVQFRTRVVWYATGLVLATHFAFIAYGLATGMPAKQDWYAYTLGESVVLSDVLVSKPIVYLGLALLISFAIRRSLRMISSIGEMEAQKATLSRYFAPSVVHEIASGSQVLSAGRRQTVTILFCDIRNFTSYSEGRDPEEVVRFLTEFRDRMAAIIFDHGGTLDKFIGDAIMANFGTPDPAPNPGIDARNAVRAAREMLRALDAFATGSWGGGAALAIGIGIHTGPVFAGRIGSDAMLEYTVIGDTVNTASRIEALCKKLGRPLLVSEATRRAIEGAPEQGAAFPFEHMPRVRVKGKSEPLVLFGVAP